MLFRSSIAVFSAGSILCGSDAIQRFRLNPSVDSLSAAITGAVAAMLVTIATDRARDIIVFAFLITCPPLLWFSLYEKSAICIINSIIQEPNTYVKLFLSDFLL